MEKAVKKEAFMAQVLCPVCGGIRGGSYDSCYKCNGTGYYDDGNDSSSSKSSSDSSSSSSTSQSYYDPASGVALAKEKNALVDSYCDKGIELYNQGNYDGAINEFNKALSYSIVHADSYGWRGRSYIGKKNYDKAIEDLTMAISTLLPDAENICGNNFIVVSLDYRPLFYSWRFIAYKGIENNEKAYADLKKAADWDKYLQQKGKEVGQYYEDDQSKALYYLNLYKINYTPKIPDFIPFSNDGNVNNNQISPSSSKAQKQQSSSSSEKLSNSTEKGKMTFANCGAYEGDLVKGKAHGKGEMIYFNGNIYEGDWVNGKEHGKGIMTYADGKVEEGRFENGKFVG